MKTKLMMVALAATMAIPAPALAFNPLEWFLKEAVEDAAKDAMKDAVLGTGKTAITSNAPSAKNGKEKKRVDAAPGKDDYRFLPTSGRHRFVLPEGMRLDALNVGARGGYLDRYGCEWVPSREKGEVATWTRHVPEKFSKNGGNNSISIDRDGNFIPARPAG